MGASHREGPAGCPVEPWRALSGGDARTTPPLPVWVLGLSLAGVWGLLAEPGWPGGALMSAPAL